MAEEVVAAIGYVYDIFAGASAAEAGAGAAADVGSAAASANAIAAAGSTASSAATYAGYASVASAALTGVSAYQSSVNQAESAKYNATVASNSAQQAMMQAGAAEDAQRRQAGLVLGEQRAAFAGSGVDPNSGSGLLVQQQSSANAELDALNIRYQGLLKGQGLLAQSELDTRQSQIYSQNANLGAINSGLSTLGAYGAGRGRYLSMANRGSRSYGGYGGGYD